MEIRCPYCHRKLGEGEKQCTVCNMDLTDYVEEKLKKERKK